MKDYVAVICAGSILLMFVLGWIYSRLYEWAEKKETKFHMALFRLSGKSMTLFKTITD